MKKLFSSALVIFSVIFSFFLGFNYIKNKAPEPELPQILGEQKVSPQPTVISEPEISNPVNLKIPKINIDSQIEEVEDDSQGRMDVPKDAMNVAWYKLGYKIGEGGSAVLAGHFDMADGSPAIFYDLEKLEVGDEILTTTETGQEFRFKVTDKKSYDFDKVPMQEIFLSDDKARLNLITCEGIFNKSDKNYSKRLVIFSELQKT